MNRQFDFCEYAGVLVPGAILCLGLLWLFPDDRALFGKDGVTFGELGLFIVVSYAAGQLIQSVGNCLEWLFWRPWGGMPSTLVFDGKYLSKDQHHRALDALRRLSPSKDLFKLPNSERLAIVREVYSAVAAAGQAARVDIFNGNYGLVRGLAASLVVLLGAALITSRWSAAALWPSCFCSRFSACIASAAITRSNSSCAILRSTNSPSLLPWLQSEPTKAEGPQMECR